jgi:hypothetical protein
MNVETWMLAPCFDYSGIYAVSNAEYPCAQLIFGCAVYNPIEGKFSFLERATNSVCVWKLLQLCRMASFAVTKWSCANMNFNKFKKNFSNA